MKPAKQFVQDPATAADQVPAKQLEQDGAPAGE